MHHDFFDPLRDIYSRFGRGDGVRDQVEPRCELRDGFMKKAVMRRGACLGLVLAALTHASGCRPDCDFSRDVLLMVELVDEDGVHLPSAAFAAAVEAATVEVCVGGRESRCFIQQPDDSYEDRGTFELWHSDLADIKQWHCEVPSVRFSVEIPGCEPNEFVLAGQEATTAIDDDVHDGLLTIVCPGE